MLHRWHVCSGQKSGSGIGKTKKAKGAKIMATADASGLPVSVWAGTANTHELKLAEEIIDSKHVNGRSEKLIGDQAYDSDPLDIKLKKSNKANCTALEKQKEKGRAILKDTLYICQTMESVKTLCMASESPPLWNSIRFPCREFPRFFSACMCENSDKDNLETSSNK